MLSRGSKQGIIISKTPVLRAGIGGIVERHFPDYELASFSSLEEITLLQLKSATLIITDLTGEQRHARRSCQQYYSLLSQCDNTHWLFFVSRNLYPVAVELLMRPQTTLLSEIEPIESIISAISSGQENAERISSTLLSSGSYESDKNTLGGEMLTLSERKVLRLLGKGWGINQIAMLLKKSNKTISAQKNSAMRRLSLRSNADLYLWINSTQGLNELNLGSAFGEPGEWKIIAKREMLPSSKNA